MNDVHTCSNHASRCTPILVQVSIGRLSRQVQSQNGSAEEKEQNAKETKLVQNLFSSLFGSCSAK